MSSIIRAAAFALAAAGVLAPPAASAANLAILNLSAPTSAAPGATISVSCLLTYTRSPPWPEPVTRSVGVGLFLGSNASTPTSNRLLSRVSVTLTDGYPATYGASVTVPADMAPGAYYLGAMVDYPNAVLETSETDNAKSVPITVGPDLLISSVTAPAYAARGGTLTIQDTVLNRGSAAGPFTVHYRISPDPTITAADAALGTRTVAGLGTGASSSATTSWTLPAASTGPVYVGVVVDSGGTVAEANETNNTAARPLSIEECLLAQSATQYCYDGAGNVTARWVAGVGLPCRALVCP